MKKIKEIKIVNQDESTEIANIGADAVNVDYNNTTVKAELDKLNSDNNENKSSITNLQNELDATNSNLSLQTSRINNLAHLDEGSTTGDAELIDIRIGSNNRNYNSAGESVRGQNEYVYTTIEMPLEQGGIYAGRTAPSDNYVRTSEYLLLSKGDFIHFDHFTGGTLNFAVYYYTEQKEDTYFASGGNVLIPVNSYYSYEIEHDGYVKMRIERGSQTALSPSDLTNVMKYTINNVIHFQNECSNKIIKINDTIDNFNAEAKKTNLIVFEQGGIYGGIDTTDDYNKYVRSANFIYCPKGTKIHFLPNNFQIQAYIYYYGSPSVNDYISGDSSLPNGVIVNAGDTGEYTTIIDGYIRYRISKGSFSNITVLEMQNKVYTENSNVNILSNQIFKNTLYGKYLENEVDCIDEIKNYLALFNGHKSDSFLFFTDPHLLGKKDVFNIDKFNYFLSYLEHVYNLTPCNFIACGGDWLNTGDTANGAKYKLGFLAGIMSHMFGDKYKAIIGNHDTNYLGVTELEEQTLSNLWYQNIGKNYYHFKTPNARYYILDTGEENKTTMNEYRWAEMEWLINSLIENDDEYSILMFHIFYMAGASSGTFTTTDIIEQIITAYNAHTTLSLNNKTYDFSNCTGKIIICQVGHSHADFETTLGNIPVVGTINFTNQDIPSFDLVYIDYEEKKYNTIRIGTGSNRTIDF